MCLGFAPSEFWTVNNYKTFILQMNFLRPTVFQLQTDDSNPIFQSENKNVSIMRHTNFFREYLPLNLTKNFIFQNRNFASPFSFHLLYQLEIAWTIGALRNYDPVK